MSKHGLIFFFASLGSLAANAQHVVSLSAGYERIDNPSMSASNPGSVTLLRLAPTYTYEDQGDRSRSRLTAGAVIEQSGDTVLLPSRVYPSLGYNWTYFWPTASLGLRTSFTETSTRNTQFEEEGRVTVDSKVRSLVAGGLWTQAVTEKTRLELDVAGTQTNYDSPLLEDHQEWSLSSRVVWASSAREQYYIAPAYSRLNPDGTAAESTRVSAMLGMNLDLGPDWSLEAGVGVVNVGGLLSVSKPVGRVQLSYEGSRLSGGLDWSREMSASGTVTGYVETYTSGVRLSYRVNEVTSLTANFAYVSSGGASRSKGLESRLLLENEISANLSGALGIETRRTQSSTANNAKGWAVKAGLVYAYPGR